DSVHWRSRVEITSGLIISRFRYLSNLKVLFLSCFLIPSQHPRSKHNNYDRGMENCLYLSPHLRFADGGRFIYHSLFGNLARIDEELRDALTGVRFPLTESDGRDVFGQVASEVLKQNYFLVTNVDEERLLLSDWLREREGLLPTGYYLESLQ